MMTVSLLIEALTCFSSEEPSKQYLQDNPEEQSYAGDQWQAHPFVGSTFPLFDTGYNEHGIPTPVPTQLRKARLWPQHTEVIYGANGFVTPESDTVFVFFGGAGGSATTHSLRATMSPIMNKLAKKKGSDSIAFELPFYFFDRYTVDMRRKPTTGVWNQATALEHFSDLRNMMDWFSWCLREVLAHVRLAEQERFDKKSTGKNKRIIIVARSYSVHPLMEAIAQAYHGNPDYKDFLKIDHAVTFGLAFPSDVDSWKESKSEGIRTKNIDSNIDQPVTRAYGATMRDFTWEPNETIHKRDANAPPLPHLAIVAGGREEFVSKDYQLHYISEVHRAYPAFPITAYLRDTEHDAGRSLNYNLEQNGATERIRASVGDRLIPILRQLAQTSRPRNKGLQFDIDPLWLSNDVRSGRHLHRKAPADFVSSPYNSLNRGYCNVF